MGVWKGKQGLGPWVSIGGGEEIHLALLQHIHCFVQRSVGATLVYHHKFVVMLGVLGQKLQIVIGVTAQSATLVQKKKTIVQDTGNFYGGFFRLGSVCKNNKSRENYEKKTL